MLHARLVHISPREKIQQRLQDGILTKVTFSAQIEEVSHGQAQDTRYLHLRCLDFHDGKAFIGPVYHLLDDHNSSLITARELLNQNCPTFRTKFHCELSSKSKARLTERVSSAERDEDQGLEPSILECAFDCS